MWQCSNCGTANSGNLCRQCGLPAYQADAHFEDNLNAGVYDMNSPEQPAPERPQAYRRPKAKKSKAAWLCCLLAFLLSALSYWQSLQPLYRFSFAVDTSNISQTLESVLDYVNLDLVEELEKLHFDGTYSIQELYKSDGEVTQLAGQLRTLTTQADEVLRYLRIYGYMEADEAFSIAGVTRLLEQLSLAQRVARGAVIGLGVLLVLGLLLLLFKKVGAADVFLSLSALLTAALPLLACTLLNRALEYIGQALSPITAYGIGFRASFALSSIAVILLSAAALVFIIFSRVAKALSR